MLVLGQFPKVLGRLDLLTRQMQLAEAIKNQNAVFCSQFPEVRNGIGS
jgi:hypothetical protein